MRDPQLSSTRQISTGTWLEVHAALHYLEVSAETAAEHEVAPLLALARLELTAGGRRAPLTDAELHDPYNAAYARVTRSALSFADRLQGLMADLARLEQRAATLDDALPAGRSRLHVVEAVELFGAHQHWRPVAR